MTKFKIKVKSSDCIEIWKNRDCLAESDDFKEVLTYIATLIVKENISKYKIVVWEKGKTQELSNFNPNAIIKDNPDIEFDEEDDDDDIERHSRRNRRHRNFSDFEDENDDERRPSQRWTYQPRYTTDDYSRIGKRLADELSNRND